MNISRMDEDGSNMRVAQQHAGALWKFDLLQIKKRYGHKFETE